METTDPTLAVLRELRDEGQRTNERLEQTNERIDQLTRRVVESEMRTASALTTLAGSVNELSAMLRWRCVHDIAEPKTKRSA
ncbi:MAG: hypothetical protein DI536_28060 [Archangium gephyra]|uniref:Uncharacterized protein n=1 Tax=Archangium gephyra TaxID=48 RepID=A0A2W5SZU1_9BACT|nr:MAG: hypothetical protein DI536_28060 [Archangium gephyra]